MCRSEVYISLIRSKRSPRKAVRRCIDNRELGLISSVAGGWIVKRAGEPTYSGFVHRTQSSAVRALLTD